MTPSEPPPPCRRRFDILAISCISDRPARYSRRGVTGGGMPMNTRTIKRIGLGLLTTVVILTVFDALPSLVPGSLASYRIFGIFYFWPAVEGGSAMFVAAFAGAYVARVHLVVPSVILAAVLWLFVVYFANSIAAAVSQTDVWAVAGSNILALIFGLVGAAAGAFLGWYLSIENESSATSAA